VPTVVAVAVFLVLLMLATQVLFDLFARSALTAAAFDAARVVAGSDASGTPSAQLIAEEQARRELGSYGSRASFSWSITADQVELSIHAHNSSLLPVLLSRPMGLDDITRTVLVRRERVRQ
jgi:hypothetical protein